MLCSGNEKYHKLQSVNLQNGPLQCTVISIEKFWTFQVSIYVCIYLYNFAQTEFNEKSIQRVLLVSFGFYHISPSIIFQ